MLCKTGGRGYRSARREGAARCGSLVPYRFVHCKVPISSCNTAFEEIVKSKKRVIVLNKVRSSHRRGSVNLLTTPLQAELASANQLQMARKKLFVDNEVVIETSVLQQRCPASSPHSLSHNRFVSGTSRR